MPGRMIWINRVGYGFLWSAFFYAIWLAATGLGPRWLLCVLFIACLLCIMIYASLEGKMRQKQFIQLDETCDPEPALHYFTEMSVLHDPSPGSYLYYANRISLLLMSGRDEEAEELMLRTEILLPRRKQNLPHFSAQINALGLRLYRGDLDGLSSQLEMLWDEINDSGLAAHQKSELLSSLNFMKYDLLLSSACTDEPLLSDLRLSLAKSNCLRSSVCAHMRLGRYDLLTGDKDSARAHLEFVAQNGNKLALRQQAEVLLNSLCDIPR